MGLSSFWSNITGPKVKEITPQAETGWLERGRPSTSAGTRFGKRSFAPSSQDFDNQRPGTANGEKRFRRIGRSLSRPRRAHPSDSDIPRTNFIRSDVEDDVPDVPSLPSSLSQDNSRMKDLPTPDDSSSRPGTSLTPEGLQAFGIFELPADPITLEAPICFEDPQLNRKHYSTVRQSKPPSRGRCFQVGAGTNKALPPPPPTIPLPPIPTLPSPTQQSYPRADQPPLKIPSPTSSIRRSHSSGSRSDSRPRFMRSKSENNVRLHAFPAAPTTTPQHRNTRPRLGRSSSDNNFRQDMFSEVPVLLHDNEHTPSSSVTNSEASSVASPTYDQSIFSFRDKCVSGQVKFNGTNVRGHTYKDSGIGSPRTPVTSGWRCWSRHVPDVGYEDEDDVDVIGWTEAELRDWEPMAMQSPEMDSKCMSALDTNEKALAALHFGVLR